MRFSDRLARFFLVQPGERGQTGYFLLIFLLLGAGLAIGRGSVDALFFKRYGFEYLPLMFVLYGLLLAIVSTVYAAYADRISSEKFFVTILVSLAVILISTWLMMSAQVTDLVYPAYFLVFEVSSEILMMHALFYLSQNIETQQSKRLSPLIFAAAQLGRITGGMILTFASGLLGVQNLVLLWIFLCAASVVLVVRRHRHTGVSPYYRPGRKGRTGLKHTLDQVHQGLRFVGRSELLKAASFALFFLVVSYYIASYAVNRIYTDTFRTEEALSSFFGLLTAVTAGTALFIQLFMTGKLLRQFGIKKVNLVFPVTSIASYLLLITSFVFPAALVASFNKDALMTAIRNPTRNLFFNALPDYMQGRGRASLLAVVLPAALVVTGAFLYLVRKMDNPLVFLAAGLVASVVYLAFNVRMNRAYVRTILNTLRERVFLPERQMEYVLKEGGEALLEQLVEGVAHEDPDISVAHASMLVRGYPEKALLPLLNRMKRADKHLVARLIKYVRRLELKPHRKILWQYIKEAEGHFQTSLYSVMFSNRDPRARALIIPFLHSSDPVIQATGVYGVYRFGWDDLNYLADKVLAKLLQHPDREHVLAGLNLLRRQPVKDRYAMLRSVLVYDDPLILQAALEVLVDWQDEPDDELLSTIQALCVNQDHRVREACAKVLACYRDDQVFDMLVGLLEDRHPDVRREAVLSLGKVLVDAPSMLLDWVMINAGSPRAQQSVIDEMDRGTIGIERFKKVAEARIDDARRCRALLEAIQVSGRSKQPASELVMHVLRERIQQYTDVILGVLGYLEDPQKVSVIRAGLQSGDARQIANACEALSELKYRGLAGGLESLFGFEPGSAPPFKSTDDGLNWVAKYLDPWASQLARRALVAT